MIVGVAHRGHPFYVPWSLRIIVPILAIVCCLFLIQASARFGLSRMFARYAIATNSIEVADAAVRLAPSDPEARRARATLQRSDEAVQSLQRAVALRYRDDYLWIELGNRREEVSDMQGALVALDQAVRWAPHYAHTHWQRGNLLLRMGQPNEAFAALRTAAAASPRYAPNVIDLAWGISGNDLKTTKALLDIKNDNERLALIRHLARKGKGKEVREEFGLLTDPSSVEYTNELARLLFEAKAFKESFALLHPGESFHKRPLLNNDFEEPLLLNESGFDWIITPQPGTSLAIDVSEKLSGAKSLQINFDGDWAPGTPLLSQTLVVDPGTSYRLSFAVKTNNLVTGGPPLLVVDDASNGQLLGKSENFPTATSPWITMSLDFTTTPASQAAVVRLQRTGCHSSPCPIFGTLWLDEFYVEQTKLASKR